MSSYRDRYDEGIGPFDTDPNRNSRRNGRGRISSLFPMTVEQFYMIRADFVAKFKEWRNGTPGKISAQMAEILEYMADDLDHFKTAMTNKAKPCFPNKCDMIRHEILQLIKKLHVEDTKELCIEIKESMAYIGCAIGRLTLEGETHIDAVNDIDAVNETLKFVKIHTQHVWDFPELGFSKEAEGLRTRLWTVYTNVNFSMAGCGCFQCNMYWKKPKY